MAEQAIDLAAAHTVDREAAATGTDIVASRNHHVHAGNQPLVLVNCEISMWINWMPSLTSNM